jgi:hypothetical protein
VGKEWKLAGTITGPQWKTVRYRWRGTMTALVIPVVEDSEAAVEKDVERRSAQLRPRTAACLACSTPAVVAVAETSAAPLAAPSRAPRLGIARMRLGDLVTLAREKYGIDAAPEMGRDAIMKKIREIAHV